MTALAACAATAAAALALLLPGASDGEDAARRAAALTETSRVLATAVDTELEHRAQILAALAASPALDQPGADLRALYGHALAAAGVLEAPVLLADLSLAQLVNTTLPFGTILPALEDAAPALRALESGGTAVMRSMGGAEGPARLVVAVPVKRAQRRIAVLITEIQPEVIGAVLDGALPAGMAAAVVEPDGTLVAAATQMPFPATATATATAIPAPAGAEGGPAFAQAARPLRLAPDWRLVVVRPPMPATGWRVPPSRLAIAALSGLAALLMAAWALRGRPGGAAPQAAERETEALRALSELRVLHNTIPVGLALLGRDLLFVSVNARMAALSGLPPAEHIGRSPAEILPASLCEPLEDAHREVLRTGKPVLDVPMTAEAPGAVRNLRHFRASFHPIEDASGRIEGVGLALQDVTARLRAEAGRDLLVRELNHRVKNTLTAVLAIIDITLRRTGGDPDQMKTALRARLQAMARGHDLLTAHDWEPTDLAEVAQAALGPWLSESPPRLLLEGAPGVLLRPSQAQAIVLALHELATNATKYGAFSREEGRVRLHWQTDSEGWTQLLWAESGGPPVSAPPADRRGFGSRLLQRALAPDLGAGTEVALDFVPEGLQARVRFRGAGGVPVASAAPLLEAAPAREESRQPAPDILA
ncbi:HWE histidine kinase domain-containing protein [Roseomonas sp. E05]|uniref:sensor histidine kinase n=1 Tax=Roseomonas sp. E05 TaxID=3046310 RepID=UPI0024BA64B5|nr:HWE histidine kinase domain-containing protein [Roseomonas sp. E05]MDJ0387911.1 HWE histidine kinase domain-containing protein [Roseomonas sp. E05]